MTKSSEAKRKIQLPKDALHRINLGHSFAEYDGNLLQNPSVFVRTPALNAALDSNSTKCFFVGRRGTGKTAIAYHLTSKTQFAIPIHPLAFVPASVDLSLDELRDTRQRPFQSLIRAYMRALVDEALSEWARNRAIRLDRLPDDLTRERPLVEDFDFDKRAITLLSEIAGSLAGPEKDWLKDMNRAKVVVRAADELGINSGVRATILLDRLDEAWDGSDKAVLFLMALMHACVQLTSNCKAIRVLLFLRENIFERVRQLDNEFARLETSVVSLDWTRALLLELVERRLQLPFTTKPALGGETWDHFFECDANHSSQAIVFSFCHERPRDILTYCSFAIETAQSQKHNLVTVEDLQAARRRFSESRLKDLADEYSENFPHVGLMLGRFYGLGNEFVLPALTGFIQKLLVDEEIKQQCAMWFFRYTAPVQFVELLYNIGFIGIRTSVGISFRSLGIKSPTPPPIESKTHAVIHPCYCDALNVSQTVISTIGDDITLRSEGIVLELPQGTSLESYQAALDEIREEISTLPLGHPGATQWEKVIGDVLRLCFFQALVNVEERCRNQGGTVIRDWIAANVAQSGFWEMVRVRYGATQVIWECKNCIDLQAEDFHQAMYYISRAAGRFVVIAFRGEIHNRHYEHLRRIAESDGLVLLLGQRDIEVFVRQARNGKLKESHIRDVYDRIVRKVS